MGFPSASQVEGTPGERGDAQASWGSCGAGQDKVSASDDIASPRVCSKTRESAWGDSRYIHPFFMSVPTHQVEVGLGTPTILIDARSATSLPGTSASRDLDGPSAVHHASALDHGDQGVWVE